MTDSHRWQKRVRVYRALNLPDAQLVKDLIEQSGIPVEQRGTNLHGLAGGIPIRDAMPTLWVAAHNKDRAAAIITAMHEAHRGDAWLCTCGERNTASFGSCWSCGTDRPDLFRRLSPPEPETT